MNFLDEANQGCHRGYNSKSSVDGFNPAIVRLDGRIAGFKHVTDKSIPSMVAAILTRLMLLRAIYAI